MARFRGCTAWLLAAAVPVVACAGAAGPPGADTTEPWPRPYDGPTRADIDVPTLDGKVLCGCQGGFNSEKIPDKLPSPKD